MERRGIVRTMGNCKSNRTQSHVDPTMCCNSGPGRPIVPSLTEMSLFHPDGLQGFPHYLKMSHCAPSCSCHYFIFRSSSSSFFNMFLFLLTIYKEMRSKPFGHCSHGVEKCSNGVSGSSCSAFVLFFSPLLTVFM